MHDVVRRIWVSLFVVSFVFSGATWAACIDLPEAQAAVSPMVTAYNHHNSAVADHGAHHNADGGQSAAGPDQDPSPDLGHAHSVKCCSMAPAASLTPNLTATSVHFSGAAISFRISQRDLTGFIVALEPGIPKPIV